jgi:hypothetical protein
MLKSLFSGAAIFALALAAVSAQAETGEVEVASNTRSVLPADPAFAKFQPRANLNADRIDYTAWSEALDYIVFSMGRSLRESPGRPDPGLGSRRLFGHDSRYRLEGNRVMFSFFTPELRDMIADYRLDLEQTGSSLDIASLPRNEQLAFWFNLHNVALIDKIGAGWPVRQPREIEIDGVPLDEAKFMTVSGVKMSPRDIREQIVYRHWSDPKVIYGFWRGEIGGPSIQADSYNGAKVGQQLDRAAREFVNSLRGTQKLGGRLQVAKIYDEARPFFFKSWPADMRAHLAVFADDEVNDILAQTNTVEAVIEEADIADLAGGVREPTYSLVTTTGRNGIEGAQSFRIPPGTARLLREQQRKVEKIIREGRTGEVIFNPIALPGMDSSPPEVE